MTELVLILKTALAVATPLGGLIWYIINGWDKKTERLITRVDKVEDEGKEMSVDIQALKTGKVSFDDLNKAIQGLEQNMSAQLKDLSLELKKDRSEDRQESREDMRELKEMMMHLSNRKDDH